MIDLSKEKLVLLAHAPPVTPGHPSAGTLRHWGRDGIQVDRASLLRELEGETGDRYA